MTRIIQKMLKAYEISQTKAALNKMTDRQLDDIGIVRENISKVSKSLRN